MTLNYDFGPIEPLLVLNNGSKDFTSLVSFPDMPGVTVVSATVDPATGKLVVVLDYSQDLQDKDLKIQITPPNVPQAFLIEDITHTWKVEPTNQLAAVVYSKEDYNTNAKIRNFANGILYFGLTIIIITMVYRKFIGL